MSSRFEKEILFGGHGVRRQRSSGKGLHELAKAISIRAKEEQGTMNAGLYNGALMTIDAREILEAVLRFAYRARQKAIEWKMTLSLTVFCQAAKGSVAP